MADLELLDCGGGRRLERFGAAIVDRPAPAADWIPRLPAGEWKPRELPLGQGRLGPGRRARTRGRSAWEALTLECRPSSSGQVGVFPEHAGTWTWLERVVRRRRGQPRPPAGGPLAVRLHRRRHPGLRPGRRPGRPRRLVAARRRLGAPQRGALGARPTGRSAGSSTMPATFARRERRRGRRYDGVVLDPPTYGHGAGAWRIEEHLAPLLEDLAALVGPRPTFVLLSAHTPGYDGDRLAALVREHFGVRGDRRAADAREPRRIPAAARGLGAQPGPLTAPAPASTRHDDRAARSPARRTRASGQPPPCATGASATRPA